MIRLVLYGTSGCHLCEEAEALLVQAMAICRRPREIARVDIADVPELAARYGTRIPVLREKTSGTELDWPFYAERLQDFLDRLP